MSCYNEPKLDLGQIRNSEDIYCYLEGIISIGHETDEVIDYMEYVIEYIKEGLEEFRYDYEG